MKRALFFLTLCTILSLTASSGALFAENTQEENAVISEIVKLNQEKWAKIQSIRVEYDVLRPREGNETPDKGNYWEVSGDEYRYFTHIWDMQTVNLKFLPMKMCLEGYANKEKLYELKFPQELYPLDYSHEWDPVNNHVHREIRDVKDGELMRIEAPFIEYFGVPQGLGGVKSLVDILEDGYDKEIKTYVSKSGDKIVTIKETIDDDSLSNNIKSWSLELTIDLSKGAMVEKAVLETTWKKNADREELTNIAETSGSDPSEITPGFWAPQKIQTYYYHSEQDKKLSSEITVTDVSINKPFPTPIDDFKFPGNVKVE